MGKKKKNFKKIKLDKQKIKNLFTKQKQIDQQNKKILSNRDKMISSKNLSIKLCKKIKKKTHSQLRKKRMEKESEKSLLDTTIITSDPKTNLFELKHFESDIFPKNEENKSGIPKPIYKQDEMPRNFNPFKNTELLLDEENEQEISEVYDPHKEGHDEHLKDLITPYDEHLK